MLYLDSVGNQWLSLHLLIPIVLCKHQYVTPLRTAVDLGKHYISDDHFQPLETSMEYLGRQAQSL